MGDGASRHEQQVAPSNSRTDSQTKYQDVDQKVSLDQWIVMHVR
jgi:hypothetical protein